MDSSVVVALACSVCVCVSAAATAYAASGTRAVPKREDAPVPPAERPSGAPDPKPPPAQDAKRPTGSPAAQDASRIASSSSPTAGTIVRGDFQAKQSPDRPQGWCKRDGLKNADPKTVSGPDLRIFDPKTGFFSPAAFAGGAFNPPPPTTSADKCEWVKRLGVKFDPAHWCVRNGQDGRKLEKIADKPSSPGMYVGRFTVYDGPTAQCVSSGVNAFGNLIALSPKFYGKNNWRAPMHGKCACLRVTGAAPEVVRTGMGPVQKEAVRRVLGKWFKVQVGDSCGECDDDHADIFVGSPEAPQGAFIKAVGGHAAAYAVGTFKGEWKFSPCDKPCA